MNYPFWDVSIGYGILMASIAVIHVFVSHFAIGGGLYLVVAETAARKNNDTQRIDYLRKLSKFFILLTVVFGALTGVGIWFIIGLLNPAATEVLIHNFVWFWAIEWTFFLIEICAAILYFYGWDRMTAKDHMVLGWIYFVSAWMSLFVINGIITFMLTPGEWLETGNIWLAFFNPTFWPSLVMRTGICIMLAGIYSMLVASRCGTDFRIRTVRYNAIWAIAGLVLTLPSFYWYWISIPSVITEKAVAMMPTPMDSIMQSYWYAGAITVLVVVFGLILPRRQHIAISLVTLIFGLAWFGSFEWFRESVRKPYVISGYMFGNSVEVAKTDIYKKDGYLQHIAYRTGNDGSDLFRRSCRSCHTLNGYKPLKPAFDGTDQTFVNEIIKGLHVIRGNMPGFYGTDDEALILAEYIHERSDQRHLKDIYKVNGVELGRKVYEIRCGKCHVIGGYNDKSSTVLEFTKEDLFDFLDFAGEIAEEMPSFTGDNTEKEALYEYLSSLKKGAS